MRSKLPDVRQHLLISLFILIAMVGCSDSDDAEKVIVIDLPDAATIPDAASDFDDLESDFDDLESDFDDEVSSCTTIPSPSVGDNRRSCSDMLLTCLNQSRTDEQWSACWDQESEACIRCVNLDLQDCAIRTEGCDDEWQALGCCLTDACPEGSIDCETRAGEPQGDCGSEQRAYNSCVVSARDDGSCSLFTAVCIPPQDPCVLSDLGSRLGSVASGNLLDQQDVLEGECTGEGAVEAVYRWSPPSDGVYSFRAHGRFSAFFPTVEYERDYLVELRTGPSCDSSTHLGCNNPSLVNNPRIQAELQAGIELLIVVSKLVDEDDQTANFTLDISACEPDCSDRACGDDGCGGTCGDCQSNEVCVEGSSRSYCKCEPQCSGRDCGDDGCGGSCGVCAATHMCSSTGQCTCSPQCSGRECGDNGCGGSCGFCSSGEQCNSSGTCIPVGCNPVSGQGCSGIEQCLLLSNEDEQCAVMGSGTRGDACSSTSNCNGGFACFAGTCQKLCYSASGSGCRSNETCAAVSGWGTYGVCTP